MKALGLVVSDKYIFENCILKTYFLTLWPTFATNWNNLNNFGRGPPRDHSCEVWPKSNERFQRRRCLSKKVYARRTTHDDRQRPVTIAHHEHFVLRWAKKGKNCTVTGRKNMNAVIKIQKQYLQIHTLVCEVPLIHNVASWSWYIILSHKREIYKLMTLKKKPIKEYLRTLKNNSSSINNSSNNNNSMQ